MRKGTRFANLVLRLRLVPGVDGQAGFSRSDREGNYGSVTFPMHLFTRLAGYDFVDVKGMIDRALIAESPAQPD